MSGIKNKLQNQRNFQSIWHSDPQYISQLLREDQLIRDYITATMKSWKWRTSEIIIKRKVKSIHIAFQIHFQPIQMKKRWTKNRVRNRIKYLTLLKTKRMGLKLQKQSRWHKRSLFLYAHIMINQLRRMYPHNQITFYIQRVRTLQFNTNLINAWILEQIKKKKSHRRLISTIISNFIGSVNLIPLKLEKTHWKDIIHPPDNEYINNNPNTKSNPIEIAHIFVFWMTANLIQIYNKYPSYYNGGYLDQSNSNNKKNKIYNSNYDGVHNSESLSDWHLFYRKLTLLLNSIKNLDTPSGYHILQHKSIPLSSNKFNKSRNKNISKLASRWFRTIHKGHQKGFTYTSATDKIKDKKRVPLRRDYP